MFGVSIAKLLEAGVESMTECLPYGLFCDNASDDFFVFPKISC